MKRAKHRPHPQTVPVTPNPLPHARCVAQRNPPPRRSPLALTCALHFFCSRAPGESHLRHPCQPRPAHHTTPAPTPDLHITTAFRPFTLRFERRAQALTAFLLRARVTTTKDPSSCQIVAVPSLPTALSHCEHASPPRPSRSRDVPGFPWQGPRSLLLGDSERTLNQGEININKKEVKVQATKTHKKRESRETRVSSSVI